MPPILALTICTIFVLWLLRLERKQSPDVSFALWIPTIWMLVNSSKPLAIWFSVGGPTDEAGSPMDRAFLIGLACIGLIIIAKRHCSWSNLIKVNIWVLILILYMLISISWSDIPFVSFKRWTREIVAIIMVFFVATERDPYQAFQSIFRRLIYVFMPFSLLLIKYYPHLGVNYSNTGVQMWKGVGIHKNGLSDLCILFIFFLIWTLIRRWRGRDKIVVWYQTYVEIFLLSLSIYLFMGPFHTLTNSVTSLISLTIALMALIGLLLMQKHGRIIRTTTLTFIIGLIIIYGTITPFVGRLSVIDISSSVGREENLTGRTEIWAELLPYVMNRPLLGHGHGGFWKDENRIKMTFGHSHNGYLEIILNIGLVGLVFFSLFLIKNVRNAQKEMKKNFDWGVLWSCFLLIAVVHNISEASSTSFHSTNIAVLLLLSFTTAAGITNRKITYTIKTEIAPD